MYSYGVVLSELATGDKPYPGTREREREREREIDGERERERD